VAEVIANQMMPRASSVPWTREHLLIALNVYGKLPFSKLDQRTPLISEIAAKMGRSKGSLAMKLSNFASLDPLLQKRGIKGLSGASNRDRELWAEFYANLEKLAPESESLLHDLFTSDQSQEVDLLGRDAVRLEDKAPRTMEQTETKATVNQRRGQQYFRQTLLNAYGVRCCVSGISVPQLLIASHIRPWRKFPQHRLDPTNGLCLSRLHDGAFDSGLMTLDEKLRVILSPKLKEHFPHKALEQNFAAFEGKPIELPVQLAEPSIEGLSYHREVIFQK